MSTPFIGQIMLVAFSFPPKGWARCNGQLLSISQNAALFSLLGTTYGGDGATNFALPDLRGRAPIHFGNGWVQGQATGVEYHTITAGEMPAHTHAVTSMTVNPGNFVIPNSSQVATASPGAFAHVHATTVTPGSVTQPTQHAHTFSVGNHIHTFSPAAGVKQPPTISGSNSFTLKGAADCLNKLVTGPNDRPRYPGCAFAPQPRPTLSGASTTATTQSGGGATITTDAAAPNVTLTPSTTTYSQWTPSTGGTGYVDVTTNAPSQGVTVTAKFQGSLQNVGGSQPHNNRQPYLALNYIIALQGIYPSRS